MVSVASHLRAITVELDEAKHIGRLAKKDADYRYHPRCMQGLVLPQVL